MIKVNDIYVVVIVMFVVLFLKEIGFEYLWIVYGQGKNICWILIYQFVENVGILRLSGMLFFYVFIGCDVVFVFWGKGKKIVW